MGPVYSIDDLKDLIHRRARLLLGVSALGVMFSVLFALSQPQIYRSTEVIQITRPQMANELAATSVTRSSAQHLQVIEQRLMARAGLYEIIDALNLFADGPDMKPDEMVEYLRNAVTLSGVPTAGDDLQEDGTFSVLSITVEMPIAQQAQQLAHELAEKTINLSIRSRIDQAQQTLNFFTTQEDKLAAEIHALKDQIAAFRRRNDLDLPENLEFHRAEIATLNVSLLNIDRDMMLIRREAAQIDATARQVITDRVQAGFDQQLLTLAAQRELVMVSKDKLTVSLAISPEVERGLGNFERRLTQLTSEMDAISAHRTEAEIAYHLENDRQTEKMTVIELARVADDPVTGSRLHMAALGSLLSVLLGFVAAYGQDLRNPVVRSGAQMKRQVGFEPLVAIPLLERKPNQANWWQKRPLMGFGARLKLETPV